MFNNRKHPYPVKYHAYDTVRSQLPFIYHFSDHGQMDPTLCGVIHIACNHPDINDLYVKTREKTKIEIQSKYSTRNVSFIVDMLSMHTNIKDTEFYNIPFNDSNNSIISFLMWYCSQSDDNVQWAFINDPNVIPSGIKVYNTKFLNYDCFPRDNDVKDLKNTPGLICIDRHNPEFMRVSDLSDFYGFLNIPVFDARYSMITGKAHIRAIMQEYGIQNERVVFTEGKLFCQHQHVYDILKRELLPIASLDEVNNDFPYRCDTDFGYDVDMSPFINYERFGNSIGHNINVPIMITPILADKTRDYITDLFDFDFKIISSKFGIYARQYTTFCRKPTFPYELKKVDMIILCSSIKHNNHNIQKVVLLFRDHAQMVLAKLKLANN